jgi:hypothetical protein
VAAAEAVEQPEPAPAPAEAAEAPATVWRPEAAPDVGPVPDIESATVQEQTPVDSASFSGEPAAAQTAISTPWPWDVVTPEVPEAESAAVEPVEESPGVVQVGAAESQVAEVDETTPPVVAEGTSDFILDLDQPASGEPVFAAEPAAPLPGVQPPLSTALDAYVCDDCAYAETCPNKGQRLPKECGSFQWR